MVCGFVGGEYARDTRDPLYFHLQQKEATARGSRPFSSPGSIGAHQNTLSCRRSMRLRRPHAFVRRIVRVQRAVSRYI